MYLQYKSISSVLLIQNRKFTWKVVYLGSFLSIGQSNAGCHDQFTPTSDGVSSNVMNTPFSSDSETRCNFKCANTPLAEVSNIVPKKT